MSVRSDLEGSGQGVCAGHAAPARRNPRGRQTGWTARLLSWPIRVYRWVISPLLGPSCRYLPTCSEYALDALREHGVWRGGRLTVGRIGRCHPWGDSCYDPVPGTDPDWDLRKQRSHRRGEGDRGRHARAT